MSARSLRGSVRINHSLHASLFKCTPEGSAHGIRMENSPHLRAPTRWCHSIILEEALGRKNQDAAPLTNYDLLRKKLCFLNRRLNITRTATCTQSVRSITSRILAAALCLLQPLSCCRVVSTSACSPRNFPLCEAALQHKKPLSPDWLPVSTPVTIFSLMAPD